jgi:hypothetical protein
MKRTEKRRRMNLEYSAESTTLAEALPCKLRNQVISNVK